MSSSTATETTTVTATKKPSLVIPSPENVAALSPKKTKMPPAKFDDVTKVVLKPVKKASSAGEPASDEDNTSEGKESRRNSGVCKWYSTVKGYGFICPEDDGEDIFVHQTAINVSGYRSLQDGESVEFEFYIDETGRRRARNVTGPKGSPVVGQPAGRASWQRGESHSAASAAASASSGSQQASFSVPMGYPVQMMAAPPMGAYAAYGPAAAGAAGAMPQQMMIAEPMRVNGRQSLRNQPRMSGPQDLAQPPMQYMTMDMYGNAYYVDAAGMQRMSMMQPVMEYAPVAMAATAAAAVPAAYMGEPSVAATQQRRFSAAAASAKRASLSGARRLSGSQRQSVGSTASSDSFKRRNSFHRPSAASNENVPRFANRIRPSLVNQARAQR